MKKRVCLFIVAALVVSLFSGCCLKHDWMEADCTHPRTCNKCGKVEGEPLGHEWEDATCAAPKTCSVCGKTKGDALEHTWVEATCSQAKHCNVCGTTDGKPLGHDLEDGIIDGDYLTGNCTVCKENVSELIDWNTVPAELAVGRWEGVLLTDGTNSVDAPPNTYLEIYADGTCLTVLDGDEYDGTWTFDYHDTSDSEPCLWYDSVMDGDDFYIVIFDDDLNYLYLMGTGDVIVVYEKA